MEERRVRAVIPAIRTTEGGGFVVRRPFPTSSLGAIDPFLLLDEMGPVEYGAGEAKGAPDHPHRGFETVTYLLSGEMVHKDSQGHSGKLAPGDVQWMTAGAGVVHSEMPSDAFLRRGGRMHGFQLWVNLPARDKMMKPRYQDVSAAKIPEARTEDGRVKVRVIAGEALGVKAVIDTRTPIFYLHYTVSPGGSAVQTIAPEHEGFAYVFRGEGLLGADARPVEEGGVAILGSDGDRLPIAVPSGASGPLEMLLIGGVPLGEPVARTGPFVMNTKEEIRQAFLDYQSGRMGSIGV